MLKLFIVSTLNDKSEVLVSIVWTLMVTDVTPTPDARVVTRLMAEVIKAALVSLRVEAEGGRGPAQRGQRRPGTAASRSAEAELRVSLGD